MSAEHEYRIPARVEKWDRDIEVRVYEIKPSQSASRLPRERASSRRIHVQTIGGGEGGAAAPDSNTQRLVFDPEKYREMQRLMHEPVALGDKGMGAKIRNMLRIYGRQPSIT